MNDILVHCNIKGSTPICDKPIEPVINQGSYSGGSIITSTVVKGGELLRKFHTHASKQMTSNLPDYVIVKTRTLIKHVSRNIVTHEPAVEAKCKNIDFHTDANSAKKLI